MAEITFNIIQGTAPYHVELIPDIGTRWNFGSAGIKTIYGIPAGSYQIKITDANGCIVISSGEIIITTTTTTAEPCCYGLLYNWYAATDIRGIAPSGWRVPSCSDVLTLANFLGNVNVIGDDLKVSGTNCWNVGNTGNNSSGFSAIGSGMRVGTFMNINDYCFFINSDEESPSSNFAFGLECTSSYFSISTPPDGYILAKVDGASIRLLKEDSTDPGTVTDYDGNVYSTIKIGTQVWMAENLRVTHYNNGEAIPNVTDNTAWTALITGALCAYDNDWETYACVAEPTTTTTTPTP